MATASWATRAMSRREEPQCHRQPPRAAAQLSDRVRTDQPRKTDRGVDDQHDRHQVPDPDELERAQQRQVLLELGADEEGHEVDDRDRDKQREQEPPPERRDAAPPR